MKTMSEAQVNKALKAKRVWGVVGKIAANAFIFFMLGVMYAPLVFIVINAFNDASVLGADGQFTFNLFRDLFNPKNTVSKELWRAVLNTVLVAVTSSAISTVLGTLGSIGMYYARKKWFRTTLEYINQIPVVNAEIVTAISLCVLYVLIFRLFKIPLSFWTLVLGHVVLSLPYVVLSVKPKLEQMDPSVYEAAMDLGANQTKALFKVVLPDIVPGVLSGLLIAITLSLDDFVITTFTKPTVGGFDTISTWVDSKMARGIVPKQLRPFTTILFAVILIVMIVLYIKGLTDAKKNIKKGETK